WNRRMVILVDATARYLNGQIAAGAEAVQVFDSWVGVLAPDDYRTFVLPHTRALIRALTPGVPVIHFGTGTGALLPLMRAAGGDVLGLDWRVDLDTAWASVGHAVGVQGNLDTAELLAKPPSIRQRVTALLDPAAPPASPWLARQPRSSSGPALRCPCSSACATGIRSSTRRSPTWPREVSGAPSASSCRRSAPRRRGSGIARTSPTRARRWAARP